MQKQIPLSAVIAAVVAALGLAGYVVVQDVPQPPAPIVQQVEQVNQVATSSLIHRAGPAEIYPDPVKTPGALNPAVTQATINSTICVKGWTATPGIRPSSAYTTALKEKQLAAGYTYQNEMSDSSYEEDHFVSLELGGNPTDEANLWPQPYNATGADASLAGAHEKDLVENFLKKQICSAVITLAQGQFLIKTDWYAVYLKMKQQPAVLGASIEGYDDPDDN